MDQTEITQAARKKFQMISSAAYQYWDGFMSRIRSVPGLLRLVPTFYDDKWDRAWDRIASFGGLAFAAFTIAHCVEATQPIEPVLGKCVFTMVAAMAADSVGFTILRSPLWSAVALGILGVSMNGMSVTCEDGVIIHDV